MRFFTSAVALLAAVTSAQVVGTGQPNAINIPNGGLQVQAGSNTVTWSNPSSGTVTIKVLPYGGVTTATDGVVVASAIPASAGTATVSIPAGSVVAGKQYVYEITSDNNSAPPNYSNNFAISGATGSATSSGSVSSSSGSASVTSTATITGSSSSGTATNTASTTSHGSSSRASTTTAAATTSPPSNTNNAMKMSGAQGGLLAFIGAVIAIL